SFNLSVTLLRVFAAFAIAMVIGTVIGLLMGRNAIFDWLADPWLIVLLNLPALVIIVLAYIWVGLTDTAAIAAVSLNKLPVTIVTIREGARTLDPGLDEMATVFRMNIGARLLYVILPQLAPYLIAAARTGLSLVWKIVLIVEMLGRPNGVGFEIGVAFQLFDVTRILAYALAFTVVMLAIEALLVQPLERHVSRWRLRPAGTPHQAKILPNRRGRAAARARRALDCAGQGPGRRSGRPIRLWQDHAAAHCHGARPRLRRHRVAAGELQARRGVSGASPASVANRRRKHPADRATGKHAVVGNAVRDAWSGRAPPALSRRAFARPGASRRLSPRLRGRTRSFDSGRTIRLA